MEGEWPTVHARPYLVGHAQKILLGLGAGPSVKALSDAALANRLTSPCLGGWNCP
jgi:hypothetical protein